MMRKNCCWFFVLVLVCYGCDRKSSSETSYPEHVGDSAFDEKVDDPQFKICTKDRIPQYYEFGKGLQYKGEKPAINDHFERLRETKITDQTGYITIRFVVNCEGKTGRFRIQQMDNDYRPKTLSAELIEKILALTKSMEGWVVGGEPTHPTDYYQYLTFKIEDGKLMEIMP